MMFSRSVFDPSVHRAGARCESVIAPFVPVVSAGAARLVEGLVVIAGGFVEELINVVTACDEIDAPTHVGAKRLRIV